MRTPPPRLPQVPAVLRRERSSWDAPSQARREQSSPGFRHPHGHVLPAGVRSVLPEEHTGAETRLCHKEGRRAGRLEGTEVSGAASRFPPPALLGASLPVTAAPPAGGPRKSPGALVKPRSAPGRQCECSRPGRPPGPSCLSCPSLSSLGAGVSGPWSPCISRGRGLGAPFPPYLSGRCLRAPVPPRPSGRCLGAQSPRVPHR